MEPNATLILFDTLSFVAKAALIFGGIIVTAAFIFALSRKGRRGGPYLEVKKLNERYRHMQEALRSNVMPVKDYKKHRKKIAKEEKAKDKPQRNVYVLGFKGDIVASAVDALREEITGILGVAGESDEVMISIESPGGVVHGYGLAASQLLRLKRAKVRLVACVDKVAASGGYMMACVADEIIAAPFAVLGSIGVAAPVPNVHRLLNEHGVDYEEVTAGEYKRTVSMFGEITEKGRAKFQEQVEDTHVLFKDFVKENRPDLDIDKIATGEYWHGTRALALGLANRLMTSDDYLMANLETANLYAVTYKKPKSLRDRLAGGVSVVVERVLISLWTRLSVIGL